MSDEFTLPEKVKAIFTNTAKFYAETQARSVTWGMEKIKQELERNGMLSDELRDSFSLVIEESKKMEDHHRELVLKGTRHVIKEVRNTREIEELLGVVELIKGNQMGVMEHGMKVMKCEAFMAEAEKMDKEYPELQLLKDPADD